MTDNQDRPDYGTVIAGPPSAGRTTLISSVLADAGLSANRDAPEGETPTDTTEGQS